MSRTIFAIPQLLSLRSASAELAPASNLLNNEPGLVFRSDGLSGVYTQFQTSAPFDVIALVGSNLSGTDTIRVRADNSEGNLTTTPALDVTISKAAGDIKAAGCLFYHKLVAPVSYTYIRIDYSSPTNPHGYVEAARLIVSKAVEAIGIDTGVEISFDNQSKSYLSVVRTTPTWKMVVSGLTEDQYWGEWDDALMDLAALQSFLFIPDTSNAHLQKQSRFCRFVGVAKTTALNSDYYNVEMTAGTII